MDKLEQLKEYHRRVFHKSHFPDPSWVLNEEGLIWRMTSGKNKVRGNSLFAGVFTFPLEGGVGGVITCVSKLTFRRMPQLYFHSVYWTLSMAPYAFTNLFFFFYVSKWFECGFQTPLPYRSERSSPKTPGEELISLRPS